VASIQKISCVTRQKLGNLTNHTGNSVTQLCCAKKVSQQSCSTLLHVWHGPKIRWRDL